MDRTGLALNLLLRDVEIADSLEETLFDRIGITGDEVDTEGLKLQFGLAGGRQLLFADAHSFGKAPDEGPALGLGFVGPLLLGAHLLLCHLQGGAEFADFHRFSTRFLSVHHDSSTQAQDRPCCRESGAKRPGMDAEFHLGDLEANRRRRRGQRISP
jgi:hypothetical protein